MNTAPKKANGSYPVWMNQRAIQRAKKAEKKKSKQKKKSMRSGGRPWRGRWWHFSCLHIYIQLIIVYAQNVRKDIIYRNWCSSAWWQVVSESESLDTTHMFWKWYDVKIIFFIILWHMSLPTFLASSSYGAILQAVLDVSLMLPFKKCFLKTT